MTSQQTAQQQPEPFASGWRLLEPGIDTWQEGDEYWDDDQWTPVWPESTLRISGKTFDGTLLGRRRIKSPWRLIKDAPEERGTQFVIARGKGLEDRVGSLVDFTGGDRTHYILLSDLPPLPPAPVDKEREAFEVFWSSKDRSYQNKEEAWGVWQAARAA